jgi:BMFP domain-containing protein YqiC
MQSQNRIFDDLARLSGGAISALSSLKQEIEAMVRERLDRVMQERLAARVAELERRQDAR